MKKIFKYVLKSKDEQVLELPSGNRILSAKEQYDDIVLYALVDIFEEEFEDYHVVICRTGDDADCLEDYTFLDTVSIKNGSLMFHVFYK